MQRFYELCKSWNNSLAVLLCLLISFLYIVFFAYIKMSKGSSGKYYQNNEKTLQK